MLWLVCATLGAGACSDAADDPLAPPPGSLLTDPFGPMPRYLRETGMYPVAPDLQAQPQVARPYDPRWPLLGNNSSKLRHVVLPRGESIDNRDSGAWRFPLGTLLFKTFAYADADLELSPVETRVMRLDAQGEWEYFAYQWNEAADDAELLELRRPVEVEAPHQGGPMHTIPAEIECRQCHEASLDPVLGVSELQLSEARGPSGQSLLSEWSDAKILAEPVTQSTEGISHPDQTTRVVLGWMHGNCVHCHNGGDAENASFDLRAAVALDNTINQPTQSSASAAGIRIVPGRPDESVLFLAVSGEGDDPEQEDMPPVGVDVRDALAIEHLRTFITNLEP